MIRNILTGIFVLAAFACSSPKNQEKVDQSLFLELSSEIKSFEMPEGWGHFNHSFLDVGDKIYFYDYFIYMIRILIKLQQLINNS